jgi:hypothetical protein
VAPPSSLDERRAAALRRCDEQIGWYSKHSGRAWLGFAVVQSAAVVLAATTPVLILWSSLPKALQALPAALASVAAGLTGTFRWLQNHSRWSNAAEALKSERVRFETRTPPDYGAELSDEAALAAFVNRVEGISMTEVSEWRSDLARPTAAEQ